MSIFGDLYNWWEGDPNTPVQPQYGAGITTMPPAAVSAQESAYISGQGTPAPTDVTYEGPSSYMDPAEQKQLFPSGLPDAGHQGGLAQLAQQSRDIDATPAPKTAAQPTEGGSQVPGPTGRGSQASRVWNTTDRTAIAGMQRAYRQEAAYGSLGHSVGTIIKILASMGAGAGAAAAGGGAAAGGAAAGGSAGVAAEGASGAAAAGGASPAAATGEASMAGSADAGAAGGSSFGSDFWQGVQGQSGSGYGNQLGQMARSEAKSMMQSKMGGGGGAGGTAGGTPGGAAGVQAQEDKYTYGSSTDAGGRTAQQLLEMHMMTPEKAWANQILADQHDELVASDIPWA